MYNITYDLTYVYSRPGNIILSIVDELLLQVRVVQADALKNNTNIMYRFFYFV